MKQRLIRLLRQAARMHREFAQLLDTMACHLEEYGWKAALYDLRAFLRNLAILLLNRKKRVMCPCCGWQGYDFYDSAAPGFLTKRCSCPKCGAAERHRFLHQFLVTCRPDLLHPKVRVLHLAPEPTLTKLIEMNRVRHYYCADLAAEKLMPIRAARFRSDLTQFACRDEAFDLVFCLHVLEHIQDDTTALREIHRVLSKGGTAIIMVPLGKDIEKTHDWGFPHPLVFGHYRGYGTDILEKMTGFEVEVITPDSVFSPEECWRFGFSPRDFIFSCRKPLVV